MQTRLLRLLVGVGAVLAALVGASLPDRARSEPLVWEPTTLTVSTNRLSLTRGGALFAAPGEARYWTITQPPLRTDDGGVTWHPIHSAADEAVRPRDVGMVVAPSDDRVLYALAPAAFYRSEDGSETWRRLPLPDVPSRTERMVLEVSPVDPLQVYVGLKSGAGGEPPNVWWLKRSDDGGATWRDLERLDEPGSYELWITAFFAHPTDPDRVFRAVGIGSRAVFGHRLERSTDRGATWTEVVAGGGGPDVFYSERLVADAAGTLYLAGNRDERRPGAVLLTSADGGQTWTPRPPTPTATDAAGTATGLTSTVTDATLGVPWLESGGVAADPTRPGRAYVAFNAYVRTSDGAEPTRTGAHVRRTEDAGATWTDLGGGDPGEIRDIAVSPDGGTVFAATSTGVWRLALD